ncbi:flagellar assembly protein FliX [Niveispirillum sp. KHB5.9]|uniref:flagellar assembly protein FliX n=1 Tax=Niveispirillum sp. KHB5.9 TaxID=3400269 RepID=UPI003A853E3E
MKIEGPSSARPGQVKKATRSGGGEFSRHIQGGDEDEGVSRSSGPQTAAGINPLFALQEVDDPTSGKKRRARARGEDILDRLDELRLGLLTGSIPLEKLHELTRVLQNRRDSIDDPRLQEILDEIDLRAQVEIAKLTPQG